MYKEKLQDSLNKYIEMKKQFDKIISSDSYQVAASSMPFDFLKARYIIETLQLFKNADDNFMINIANGDEAIVMFKNIIDFKNTADQILNGASVLMQAFDIITFSNDDGTDRQKYLKELKNQLDNNQIPYLKANLCEFIPPNKIPEPSIKITWNGNIIGFIPKEIAAEIASSYKDPQFKVKLEGISSGDDIPYGCTVKLDVISYKFKDKTEDIELY